MTKIPAFKPGDLVRVYTKIIEGDKTRIAPFQGVVIATKGSGVSKSFTVRKVSAGIGVERIFPLNSPMITKIELKKAGRVRRAKLTYLRQKKTRKMKTAEPGLEAQPTEVTEKPAETAEKPASKPADKPADKTAVKPKEKAVAGTPGQKPVEKT